MAASRHKLSIAATSVQPFVRLQVGLDGNEVTIKNKTDANSNEVSFIITATRNIDLYNQVPFFATLRRRQGGLGFLSR